MRPVNSDRRSCSAVRAAASPPPTITIPLSLWCTPWLLVTWCSYTIAQSVLQGTLVYRDLSAGYRARAITSEPHDDVGYLIGRHEAFVLQRHWREAVHETGMVGKDLHHCLRLDHRGIDRVGVNGVDPNVVLAELDRQRVGQRRESVLAGRVMAIARRGLQTRRRADHHNRTAVAGLDHHGNRGAQGAPGAGQVDPDDRVPLLIG